MCECPTRGIKINFKIKNWKNTTTTNNKKKLGKRRCARVKTFAT